MAKRRKGKGPSMRQYFMQLFGQHPEWLRTKSNDVVLERWKHDHPDEELTQRVRGNLANVKSVLKRGNRPAAATAGGGDLEQLEARIDDCLLMVRRLDSEELREIVRLLRHARNQVVLMQGEPSRA